METTKAPKITVESTIKRNIDVVWNLWTDPKHITQWCNASNEWHTPRAENNVIKGGEFLTRMESKDGKIGFDFKGIYDEVRKNEFLSYTTEDGRKVQITFTSNGSETFVSETFEAESVNSLEMQKGGWQAILDNFKKYAEAN